MSPASIIAIDGPAAAGKSTLADRLAQELGYLYFDTGVMYRAVTWAALERHIPIHDEAAVTDIANAISIDVLPPSVDDGRPYEIIVDSEIITWDIRTPIVDANVSLVSMYPGVRQAMTERQREIGLRGNVVMVGRDIGTVVLPEADLKIYLDASVEARAQRRFLENEKRDEEILYEEILQSVKERDRLDSTRDLAPLQAAEDAVVIDSTSFNAEKIFEQVYSFALKVSGEEDSPTGDAE